MAGFRKVAETEHHRGWRFSVGRVVVAAPDGEEFERDVLVNFLAEDDKRHDGDAGIAQFTKLAAKRGVVEALAGDERAIYAVVADDIGEVVHFP